MQQDAAIHRRDHRQRVRPNLDEEVRVLHLSGLLISHRTSLPRHASRFPCFLTCGSQNKETDPQKYRLYAYKEDGGTVVLQGLSGHDKIKSLRDELEKCTGVHRLVLLAPGDKLPKTVSNPTSFSDPCCISAPPQNPTSRPLLEDNTTAQRDQRHCALEHRAPAHHLATRYLACHSRIFQPPTHSPTSQHTTQKEWKKPKKVTDPPADCDPFSATELGKEPTIPFQSRVLSPSASAAQFFSDPLQESSASAASHSSPTGVPLRSSALNATTQPFTDEANGSAPSTPTPSGPPPTGMPGSQHQRTEIPLRGSAPSTISRPSHERQQESTPQPSPLPAGTAPAQADFPPPHTAVPPRGVIGGPPLCPPPQKAEPMTTTAPPADSERGAATSCQPKQQEHPSPMKQAANAPTPTQPPQAQNGSQPARPQLPTSRPGLPRRAPPLQHGAPPSARPQPMQNAKVPPCAPPSARPQLQDSRAGLHTPPSSRPQPQQSTKVPPRAPPPSRSQPQSASQTQQPHESTAPQQGQQYNQTPSVPKQPVPSVDTRQPVCEQQASAGQQDVSSPHAPLRAAPGDAPDFTTPDFQDDPLAGQRDELFGLFDELHAAREAAKSGQRETPDIAAIEDRISKLVSVLAAAEQKL